MILIANGTLLAIQNMTWGGKLGFQSPPVEPFFVPYHAEPSLATLGASGVMGTAHTERGLTYVGVDLCGHMVPQYQPTAAYRQLEFLLGRVDSLSRPSAFTTDTKFPQPIAAVVGNGTAPAGFVHFNGSGGAAAAPKASAGAVEVAVGIAILIPAFMILPVVVEWVT